MAVYQGGALSGWIECWSTSEYRHWTRDDAGLFQQIAELAGMTADKRTNRAVTHAAPELEAELEDIRSQYKRIVEYGNLLIVRTNPELELTAVHGDQYC